MSAKTSADVIIGGKVYTLSGYESEVYLQQVAAYINNKLGELEELEDYRRFTADMRSTLLELNLADDYFKAKSRAELLEEDLENKSRELYALKHELVSTQIKIDTCEKSLEAMERENKELRLNKTRLEAALEDALFGKAGKKPEAPKQEPGKTEPGKQEFRKQEPGKTEPGRQEPGKTEPGKQEFRKQEPGKTEPGKQEFRKQEPGKTEPGKQEFRKQESGKQEFRKQEPGKTEPTKK